MSLPPAADLARARANLAQAVLASGLRPTERAIYWLLGLVAGESLFGTTPAWTAPNALNTPETNPTWQGPSHNWGALKQPNQGAPFLWHPDLGDGGGPDGSHRFQVFPSALEGAKGFLHVLLQKRLGHDKVIQALTTDGGTAELLARGMRENQYYEGNPADDEDTKIAKYAAMIEGQGGAIAKALGASPAPPSEGWAKGPMIAVGAGALLLLSAWVTGAGPFEGRRPSFRFAAARDRDRLPPSSGMVRDRSPASDTARDNDTPEEDLLA